MNILGRGLIFGFILLTLFQVKAQEQEDFLYEDLSKGIVSELSRKEFISNTFFDSVYNHYNFEHFLDNYYGYGHYQTEVTGNFSTPDNYNFSLVGASHRWNRFYYQGHRFNDVYFPGGVLYKPQLYNTNIQIDLVETSVNFDRSRNLPNRVYAQFQSGNAGNDVPWAHEFYDLTNGHDTGVSTAFPGLEFSERSRIGNRGLFHFSKSGKYQHTGYVTVGDRLFAQRDFARINGTSRENFSTVFLNGELPNIIPVFDDFNYLFSYNRRDDLFAEFYMNENESAQYDAINFSLYGRQYLNPNFKLNSGVNFSFKSIRRNELEFSRNFIDQDGESLEPWYPDADVAEISLSNSFEKRLDFLKGLSLKFDSYNTLIVQNATTDSWSNTVFREFFDNDTVTRATAELIPQADTTFTSLYEYQWRANDYTSGLFENTLGLSYVTRLGDHSRLTLGADVTFDGFTDGSESVFNAAGQFDVLYENRFSDRFFFSANGGRRRIPYDYELLKFVSDDYLSGTVNFWDDSNNDRQFQENERNGVFYETGGENRRLGDDLKQPAIWYIDIDGNYKAGNWTFGAILQYRQFRNTWSVDYDRPAEDIGFFEEFRGQEFYFLRPDQDFDFVVGNFREDLFEQAAETDPNIFFEQPFYAGATLNAQHERDRLFFNISFTAYMVVGFGPLGNGPNGNQVGILSETLANPNTYINYLGRLDSDRAYIIRGAVQYKWTDRFSSLLRVKYKDGQPVSLFTSDVATSDLGNASQFLQPGQNQVSIANANIGGINPFTGEFGSREAGAWNFDLHLNYDLSLFNKPMAISFDVYNIMDVESNLNNLHFAPTTGTPEDRFGGEVQLPRAYSINLDYYF